MKKYFCIICAILLILNNFSIVSYAERSEETSENIPTQIKSTGMVSYADIVSDSDALSDIVIEATSFVNSKNIAVETVNREDAGEVLDLKNGLGFIDYEFVSQVDAAYYLRFDYIATIGKSDINVGVKIDGEYPFEELKVITLKRTYKDNGSVRKDGQRNEFNAEQIEIQKFDSYYAVDSLGHYKDPYRINLSAGKHTVEIEIKSGAFALKQIVFEAPSTPVNYSEYIKSYSNIPKANGEIIVQGENATYKSSDTLVPLSDLADSSMLSWDGKKNNGRTEKINYIGSTNWQKPEEKLTWEIDVPKTGLYKLSFRYRQKYVTNGVSYRRLQIDGKTPFSEVASIAFPYDSNWSYLTLNDNAGNNCLLYLEKGKRELSLTVSLGDFCEVYSKLSEVVEEMGTVYRKIVMITGETVDAGRSYELFKQIPDLNDRLLAMKNSLNDTVKRIEAIQGKRGGSGVSTINAAVLILDKMLTNYYTAHRYKSEYYTQYCALSSYVTELTNQPLDIDYFTLSNEKYDIEDNENGAFDGFAYWVKRMIYSFSEDYTENKNEKSTIEIWVNWGRDQTKVLSNLVQSSFAEKSGINVNLKITNASVIQGILSGNGPDLYLHMPRTNPVNYAMRGALYNLEQFDDFEEVTKRFSKSATVPYQYKGGTYALPDTQNFYVMFARDDVLSEMGLSVPKTWDEFIFAAAVLQQNNMQVALPIIQLSDISQVNTGLGGLSLFPTIALQYGANIYNEELTGTNLSSSEALNAFEFWTQMFTEYKMPVSYNFYNRFRTGTMPLAIQVYTEYISLSVAAPEITGKWSVYEIPGFEDENGNINNIEAGAGTGAVILESSKNKDAAWEFLKWWTSADTQLNYSTNVENILGVAGRVASANVEAVSRMSWNGNILDTLNKQWEKVSELPELPGGYYVPRSLDMAFWNVYNNSANPKDTLLKWDETANIEITRKMKQYEGR